MNLYAKLDNSSYCVIMIITLYFGKLVLFRTKYIKSYGVIGEVVYGVYYDSPNSKEAGSTVSTRWVNTEK